MGGLLFHVHSCVSLVHCLIEHRFCCPCCRTGYAGFSVQAHFLNSVLAVFSLNSLCQFILCINNLLPQEVISFGMFYHLICCLDHMIQSFSMTLCSRCPIPPLPALLRPPKVKTLQRKYWCFRCVPPRQRPLLRRCMPHLLPSRMLTCTNWWMPPKGHPPNGARSTLGPG